MVLSLEPVDSSFLLQAKDPTLDSWPQSFLVCFCWTTSQRRTSPLWQPIANEDPMPDQHTEVMVSLGSQQSLVTLELSAFQRQIELPSPTARRLSWDQPTKLRQKSSVRAGASSILHGCLLILRPLAQLLLNSLIELQSLHPCFGLPLSNLNFNKFLFLKDQISFQFWFSVFRVGLPKISSEKISATVVSCGSCFLSFSSETLASEMPNSWMRRRLGMNLSSIMQSSLVLESERCRKSEPFLLESDGLSLAAQAHNLLIILSTEQCYDRLERVDAVECSIYRFLASLVEGVEYLSGVLLITYINMNMRQFSQSYKNCIIVQHFPIPPPEAYLYPNHQQPQKCGFFVQILKLILYFLMINQAEQASNQYGFYAVPKALQPKKKYRETFEEESKYSDEEMEDENQFEQIDRQAENEKQLERDFYVDQAPYPDFKPKERGLDYGVQIQRHQLFDFDLEVQPLIQILVGRSVVSAINELQQEKESNERGQFLDQYQKKRNAQLMQTQRLENKHNRKQDEAKRRVLQTETYLKNKKITTQKLIARRNAKHGLLGLRNEVLGQLEEEGFLRQSTYLSLRVQYESWLYEQIKLIVNQRKRIEQSAHNIIKEKEKELANEHQMNIDKENKRKKDILDERERIRKQNEERKLKKKIRKQRLNMNAERVTKFNQAAELVGKYEPAEKILKADSISNGLTKKKNTATTVHIAGGLMNYILALINNSGGNYSSHEIEAIIEKLLSELSSKLEIEISTEHMAKIEELRAKMEADPIEFMTYKDNWIKELVQKISLEISVLEAAGVSLKSQLHSNILHALLSIYINTIPAPKMEGDQVVSAYEATDRDKKRQELRAKIELIPTQTNSLEQIKKAQNVVRVRFEKVHPEKPEQELEKPEEEGVEKPIDLDEWIDVYDGEGWQRLKKQGLKEAPREGQHASSYALTGFDNSFVMDERNLHYLQNELERLLGIQGGDQMVKYRDRLENLHNANDKIPIYDVELKWQ